MLRYRSAAARHGPMQFADGANPLERRPLTETVAGVGDLPRRGRLPEDSGQRGNKDVRQRIATTRRHVAPARPLC